MVTNHLACSTTTQAVVDWALCHRDTVTVCIPSVLSVFFAVVLLLAVHLHGSTAQHVMGTGKYCDLGLGLENYMSD